MDNIFIIWIFFTYTLADVAFHNGDPIENETLLISCYYTNKDPGISRWSLEGTDYTDLCDLIIDDGTLSQSETCVGSSGMGEANFTFVINKVSFKRDHGRKWTCLLTAPSEQLYLDVAVPLSSERVKYDVDNVDDKIIGKGQQFTASATTACFYPTSEIHWCVNNTKGEKCSDDNPNDYWQGVFKAAPTIAQTSNSSCELDYNDPVVRQITSTFSAITEDVNVEGDIQLYATVDGVSYDNTGLITIMLTDKASNAALLIPAYIFVGISLILGAVIVGLLFFCPLILFSKDLKDIVLILTVLYIIYMVVTVVAVALDIPVLVTCPSGEPEWIAVLVLFILVFVVCASVHIELFFKKTFVQTLKDSEVNVGECLTLTFKTNMKEKMVMNFKEKSRNGMKQSEVKIDTNSDEAENFLFYLQSLEYTIDGCSPADEGEYKVTCGQLKTIATITIFGGVDPAVFKKDLKDVPTTEVTKHRKLPERDYE